MPRSLRLGLFFALCFTVFIFGQVFASGPSDKKRNIVPVEGLAKAFKAADSLAALDKGSSKVSGLTSSSKKSKTSSKFTAKKSSGKKFASSKGKSAKKSSLHKSRYAKKHTTLKSKYHKKHSTHKTKTANRLY
jgi:hypothetical protein